MAQKHPSDHAHKQPHEDAQGDVGYHKTEGHVGVGLLNALIAHDDHHPGPDRVAELIAQHPHDQPRMIAVLHEHFGNKYVQQVLHALPEARDGDHHNVEMRAYNTDSADRGDNGHDPNRLVDEHHAAKLEIDSHVYSNQGGVLGPAHANGKGIKLNTGQVTQVKIDGIEKTCVFAFHVGDKFSGWVPVDAFTEASQKTVIKHDKQIDEKVTNRQKAEHFEDKSRTIVPKKVPASFEELYTMPHQTGIENKPAHYYERDGGVVNLLFNVPGTGGSRFGVASDVLAAGTKFHVSTSVPHEHTPLWRGGKHSEQTSHQLTFVYGYAENSAGSKSYGWINHAVLGSKG